MSDREELVSEAAKAAAKLLAKTPIKRTADATNGPLMLQNKRTLTQQSLPAHIQQLQTDHNASLVRALTSFYPPEALAEAAQQFEQSVTGSQLSSLHYSFSPQLIQEAAIAAAQACIFIFPSFLILYILLTGSSSRSKCTTTITISK